MNTPEAQSPIDTTDIPIDNIGNRKTLRKKGSASTNETQLRDGPVQRSAAEQNPAVFAAADSFGCAAAAVQRDRHCRSRQICGQQCNGGGRLDHLAVQPAGQLIHWYFGRRERACRTALRRAGLRRRTADHPDGAAHRLNRRHDTDRARRCARTSYANADGHTGRGYRPGRAVHASVLHRYAGNHDLQLRCSRAGVPWAIPGVRCTS